MGSSSAQIAVVERLTALTMESHPALQAGVGVVCLALTFPVMDLFPVGPRSLGTLIGVVFLIAGVVLSITGVARGLLSLFGVDSYGEATTLQQMAVLAAGTFILLGIPLIAVIALAAMSG